MGALLKQIEGFLYRRYIATHCGHRTRLIGRVHSGLGDSKVIEMPIQEDDSVDYCLSCIGKMSIRCAWCGKSIFIGSTVTSFLSPEGHVVFKYAVARDGNPLKGYIGCCRRSCAGGVDDQVGRWLPGISGKGRVALFNERNRWSGA